MSRTFRLFALTSTLLGLVMFNTACGRRGGGLAPATVRIVASHPHDAKAYTQGLLYRDGHLYESTGLYRESTLRKVEPATGSVQQKLDLPADAFGEGLAFQNGKFFVLTWRKGVAYEIDPDTFAIIKTHSYESEGWGLAGDGERLIMSDGTSTLRFIDPENFSVLDTLRVTYHGQPVSNLNELELVSGKLYANIYGEDFIVVINPESGKVTGSVDLSGLRDFIPKPHSAEVLNGIAHDPESGHFFVTGKRWPIMFELEISP